MNTKTRTKNQQPNSIKYSTVVNYATYRSHRPITYSQTITLNDNAYRTQVAIDEYRKNMMKVSRHDLFAKYHSHLFSAN